MLSALRARGLFWPAVMTVIGVVFLVALGNWQMRRLAWKVGLIAAIADRAHAAPISLAEAEQRSGDVEYLRVKSTGKLLNDRELDFYAFDEQAGVGWHIVTPLQLADGSVVFVNRGFVPDELKEPAKRREGEPSGEVEIVGLARKPETPGAFTPANDAGKNVWYWRDISAMAAAAVPGDKTRIVPFVIDAELEPRPLGVWPRGGVTRLELPNRHLEYALTWYGLAAALLGVFAAFAVTRWRQLPG
jgi:surfeit locus 1 family protein